MLDINPYILPVNQDSVKDKLAALQLAKEAEKAGIKTIIATPKYVQGIQEINKDTITSYVETLNQKLIEESVNVEILPSQTVRIHGNLEEDLEKGKYMTYGNDPTYIFLELMHDQIPQYTTQLCYDLQLKGYKPILVHPEKNIDIQKDVNILYSLVKNGALVQISARSINGKKGKKIQKTTQHLLKHNLVHFISSDTADAKQFYLQPAWDSLKKTLSIEQIYVLQENRSLLLDGRIVQGEEPVRIKKKKIFGLI
ncbi:tyrosine protein phosphatase [Gracilibacillus caseinilyticus]|uniref:Tyrosine-protein phosphatase n=1 Tax=Gracilibacillus caseinilyticus TaxID=2932256 RepID=A0ABY4F0W3_9BACI|nr:CpsB/CapC family capsule biosynthesis tyrosine phosphatase [Gracilibacillus caseinilyticus]UOQ50317.1 tyrosine protein phosphatase [Gracilibacillus caseinilyticus]